MSLLSARATGRALGMSDSTIMRLYAERVIDAEVHEGRLIRFDLEKVRKTLAKRADQNRKTASPAGMIPTC